MKLRKLLRKLPVKKGQRELVGGGAVAFAYRMLGFLFTYGLMLAIARRFGPEGNGYYNLFTAWMAVLGVLATLGLSSSNVRSVAEYSAKGEWGRLRPLHNGVLRAVVPFAVLLGLGFLAWRQLAATGMVGDGGIPSPVMLAMALVVPFSAVLLVNVEFIRGMKRVAVSELLRSPAVLGLTFLAVLVIPGGPMAPVAANAVITGCCALLGLYLVRRYLGRIEARYQARPLPINMREHLLLALPMIVTALASSLNGRLDTIMLAWYRPSEVIGIYGTAVKISIGIEFVIGAIKTIAMPKIAEMYHSGRHKELRETLDYAAKLVFWTTAPVTLVLMVFARPIMGFVGPEFAEGALVLRIMTLAHFISASSGMVGAFLNMTGSQVAFSRIVVTAVALNVGLNLLLIPTYGMTGAAMAAGTTLSLWNIAAAIFIYRKHGINMYYIPWLTKHKPVHADQAQ
ncbi:MAG: flippase [Bacteroidetes bacterium]|nr:flippase [Bacteroidota bacterium]MBS1943553.1 flippase [Bacteroidota bacterium]